MTTDKNNWTKTELEIYILLLCANADSVETPDELRLISTHVDEKSFDKIYNEFSGDSEKERFEKIQDAVALHEYSQKELARLKKNMQEIFLSDHRFSMDERNLEKILNNILY